MMVLVFTLAILNDRFHGHAQEVEQKMFPETTFVNAISTAPFLPLFSSFSITYERKQGMKIGWIAKFWYGSATATYAKEISYPGHSDNYSLILAYLRYFWKNLHAEYQTYAGFMLYESNQPESFREMRKKIRCSTLFIPISGLAFASKTNQL